MESTLNNLAYPITKIDRINTKAKNILYTFGFTIMAISGFYDILRSCRDTTPQLVI